MDTSARVLVYGAYGHTGRFVVDELLRRGLTPVLSGRSAAGLDLVAGRWPGVEQRPAAVDDPVALRRALAGTAAVVNCAGPFADTALPVATAAVAAGVHYLDLTAEQAAVQALHTALGDAARAAGVAVVPAMAFYGGLADLLATAALSGPDDSDGEGGGDGRCGGEADEITVVIALDRWWPTAGTRITGRRNTVPRLIVTGGTLASLPDQAPTTTWIFPAPFGPQPVVAMPFSEVITIARHVRVGELRTYLSAAPLADLRDPDTPPPSPADESGRSAQRFVVDVVVRRDGRDRMVSASGRDIYAVSAPIVAEGVERLLSGRALTTGVASPGEIFAAGDVLAALSAPGSEYLSLSSAGPQVPRATP
ncbi:saccharopine dehydrogenase [Jiangella ureilytica]|uniref:Saccharopine dehydrogenase n=1 Tax=Jiangella ureilytica TaxID=2530374 RepID=A0A4R4RY61_9ACTN|nr:saccharopine dehydrogenase NADP-binding domain-containing protein [Jiangella ureilytica]TDC53603.1 saccharopine dehydrogenase [Jiangella ureilytica]